MSNVLDTKVLPLCLKFYTERYGSKSEDHKHISVPSSMHFYILQDFCVIVVKYVVFKKFKAKVP